MLPCDRPIYIGSVLRNLSHNTTQTMRFLDQVLFAQYGNTLLNFECKKIQAHRDIYCSILHIYLSTYFFITYIMFHIPHPLTSKVLS